jgi:hypothetical protein
MSGLEELQNAGKEQVIDLLAARLESAERTIVNGIGADIYSDGTADGSRQIGGLQLLVADANTTGTVGGIDRSVYSDWQHALYDFSTESVTASATTIQGAMNTAFLRVTRNADVPDVIILDNVYFGYFWASLQAIQRITNPDMANLGFRALEFAGAPVLAGGGSGGGCPASHGYFLNTAGLSFRPHANRNFRAIGGDRVSVNQDATVRVVGWAGNMTMSIPRLQCVMIA